MFLNITDPLTNPIDFLFLCYREKVHDNKKFSCGNSKYCHESRIKTCKVRLCIFAVFEKYFNLPILLVLLW